MELFRQIGEKVDAQWRKLDYDVLALPRIAAAALEQSALHTKVTYGDILKWLNRVDVLPKQYANLGEPPVTLYNSSRFRVDVLFWLDGEPQPHEHRFSGAFSVLSGSSLHATFDFEQTHRVSQRLMFGKLTSKKVELLRTGDVREIPQGSGFIHSTFHLERPTLSIVIRTHSLPIIQRTFLRPNLAYDPFDEDDRVSLRTRGLATLRKVDPDLYMAEMQVLLEESSLYDSLFYLGHHMEISPDPMESVPLLNLLREKHAELREHADPIALAMYQMRETALRAARHATTEAEKRFFLATAMVGVAPSASLDLVRQRFPNEDPVEQVVRWTRELAQLPSSEPGENLLGIEINEKLISALRGLLRGESGFSSEKDTLSFAPVLYPYLNES